MKLFKNKRFVVALWIILSVIFVGLSSTSMFSLFMKVPMTYQDFGFILIYIGLYIYWGISVMKIYHRRHEIISIFKKEKE